MGRRVRHEVPVDWHVFNRGSRRMALFRDDQDAQVFLRLLQEAVNSSGCILWAYVLMTNHFHTALRGTSQQLQRCMHYVEGLYSLYHNRRYGLSGAAFEGRYEAYPQGTLPMLLRTIAYIFTNPVAAGLTETPQDYGWSSYPSFFGKHETLLDESADLLLDLLDAEVSVAQERLLVFIRREMRRIQKGEHRPGLSAKDIQANHFDWLLDESKRRTQALGQVDALTLAVFWAKEAGFHRGAIRQVLGGPMSTSLRSSLKRLRRWMEHDPARALLLKLP